MKMTFHLFVAFVLASISATALGHKNVGGGNGSGGTLLDQAAYAETKSISAEQLMKLVRKEKKVLIARFPLLEQLSLETVTAKSWYLDNRTFAVECRNQILVDLPQSIWACQNDVEVRINENFWNSLSKEMKANLIVHEIFTSLWLRGPDVKSIGGAMNAFLNPHVSDKEVALKFEQAGLPPLPNKEMTAAALRELKNYMNAFCAMTSEKGRADLILATTAAIHNQSPLNYSVYFSDHLAREAKFEFSRKAYSHGLNWACQTYRRHPASAQQELWNTFKKGAPKLFE